MSSMEGGPLGTINNPSREDIAGYAESLAEMIRGSGFNPDLIVGIERGGIIPAALVAYILEKPIVSIKVIKDGDERIVAPNPAINFQAFREKRVVVVDDMLEKGTSAQAGADAFRQHGAEVRLACFYTRSFTEIEPDYVLERNVKGPVSFPGESRG